MALANVLLLGLCMFAVFAIMGLNMFLGPRGFIVGSALRRYIIVILSLYYRYIIVGSALRRYIIVILSLYYRYIIVILS